MASVIEMKTAIVMSVPPGFVTSTLVCDPWNELYHRYPYIRCSLKDIAFLSIATHRPQPLAPKWSALRSPDFSLMVLGRDWAISKSTSSTAFEKVYWEFTTVRGRGERWVSHKFCPTVVLQSSSKANTVCLFVCFLAFFLFYSYICLYQYTVSTWSWQEQRYPACTCEHGPYGPRTLLRDRSWLLAIRSWVTAGSCQQCSIQEMGPFWAWRAEVWTNHQHPKDSLLPTPTLLLQLFLVIFICSW